MLSDYCYYFDFSGGILHRHDESVEALVPGVQFCCLGIPKNICIANIVKILEIPEDTRV